MNATLEAAMSVIEEQQKSAVRQVTTSALLNYITLAELERRCADGLEEVLDYTVEQCVRYCVSVTEYKQVLMSGDMDRLAEMEDLRKRTHNATIDMINALSRALKLAGRSNDWIGGLSGNRAAYAKFAILLAFEKIERYKAEKEAL